jgi:hypothetical protein
MRRIAVAAQLITHPSPKGRPSTAQANEGVKESISHVIPSEARNLRLFVFKEINADASLRSA